MVQCTDVGLARKVVIICLFLYIPIMSDCYNEGSNLICGKNNGS